MASSLPPPPSSGRLPPPTSLSFPSWSSSDGPLPPPPHVWSLLLLRRSDTPHARHPPGAAIVFGLRCGAGDAGAPPLRSSSPWHRDCVRSSLLRRSDRGFFDGSRINRWPWHCGAGVRYGVFSFMLSIVYSPPSPPCLIFVQICHPASKLASASAPDHLP